MTHKRSWELQLGANYKGEGECVFSVWAPYHRALSVQFVAGGMHPMERDEEGFFTLITEGAPGDLYFYRFENGLLRPDPVSRALPQGVHGPTEIVDPTTFRWSDADFQKLPLEEVILYELHIGTFTDEGTFEGFLEKLDHLQELGVTMIELMPLTEFPGKWNWGYDGVSLFAPDRSYGGVNGLKRLIDQVHQRGMGVCLDVVYNHLGPVGNYLGEFGPYFHREYHTPWGAALNYDGADSEPVRNFVIQNALYWAEEYHIDALRLDAIHGIYDMSATKMLEQLRTRLNPQVLLIAEDDRNDARHLRSPDMGGNGLSAVWNDDFHHALHVMLTGERHLYYQDFSGLSDLVKTFEHKRVYDGKYSSFRKKLQGNCHKGLAHKQFVVFSQNHDQVGNRPRGERLTHVLSKEVLKLTPFITLMSPQTPLLFMGEEYGEKHSFEYFVDFEEEALMRSIYEGRKREFHDPKMPFPGKEPFMRSKLSWEADEEILALYKRLISLRKEFGSPIENVEAACDEQERWLAWRYLVPKGNVLCWVTLEHKLKRALPLVEEVSVFKPLFSLKVCKKEGEEFFMPPYNGALFFKPTS